MSSKHYTFTPLLYQINKKNKINLKHKKTTINTGESQLFLRIASKHSWCKPLKTGECVPCLMYSPSMKEHGILDDSSSFGVLGASALDNFDLSKPSDLIGESILDLTK